MYAVLLLTACAPVRPLTDAEIAARADAFAAEQIGNWGLARGLPREARLRSLFAELLSDRDFQASSRARPSTVSATEWGDRLEIEGLGFLPDEVLRKWHGAVARLFIDASDAECVSYMKRSGGKLSLAYAFSGSDSAIWKQRLARVSDEDFDILTRIEIEALVVRSRRISEPPIHLSRAQARLAMEGLVPYVSSDDYQWIAKQNGTEDFTPIDSCRFWRAISNAQNQVSGPNASLSLRLSIVGLDE